MTSRRKKRESINTLGNHQRCWLWGRHAVLETLEAGTWPILELLLSSDLPESARMGTIELAELRGLEAEVVSAKSLEKRCRGKDHQGYAAKMSAFPYNHADELWNSASAPLVLALDGVQDAFNFGAAIRSAESFAVDGIVIGAKDQVGVTSHVVRASAGAINHTRIVRVEKMVEFLRLAAHRGLQCVVTDGEADQPVDRVDLTKPTVVVMGNEGRGVSHHVRRVCDEAVGIPRLGRVNSLNVAVAAGIVLFECRRQRGSSRV